jgi:hypothetical protein
MLMKDPKKSLAVLISSKMKKPDNMEEASKSENGGEDDKSIGYDSAAEEILKAIETKSPKMLVEALRSFNDMCESEEDESESDQQEEPSEPQE